MFEFVLLLSAINLYENMLILIPIVYTCTDHKVQLHVMQGWHSCQGPSISKHAFKVHNCGKCTKYETCAKGFIFCTLPRVYSKIELSNAF